MKDNIDQTTEINSSRGKDKSGRAIVLSFALLALSTFAIQSGPTIARYLSDGLDKARCIAPFYEVSLKILNDRLGYKLNLPLQANLSNNLQAIDGSAALIGVGAGICMK